MVKKTVKKIIKICGFLLLINLPYLTIATSIGFENFIDSFQHPDAYQYLTDTTTSTLDTQALVLVQKPSHPTFLLTEGDTILYYTQTAGIHCSTITHMNTNRHERFYTTLYTIQDATPIPEQYIIGKVMGIYHPNPWNNLALIIWETTIQNMNINTFFT